MGKSVETWRRWERRNWTEYIVRKENTIDVKELLWNNEPKTQPWFISVINFSLTHLTNFLYPLWYWCFYLLICLLVCLFEPGFLCIGWLAWKLSCRAIWPWNQGFTWPCLLNAGSKACTPSWDDTKVFKFFMHVLIHCVLKFDNIVSYFVGFFLTKVKYYCHKCYVSDSMWLCKTKRLLWFSQE